ncbi:MAG: hypothetical protein SAJ72_12765 [Jaaginema sp. PMC 1080.18]|nr:hypothetical protein [Jaaginema sp. PMC 1080.18]
MFQQLSLFENSEQDSNESQRFRQNIKGFGFNYQEIDIGDITFKAGQIESIHRWYRLTPSYSPNLVRFFIKQFAIDRKSLVLDPFSGRGTTIIECQKHGILSLGLEINPLLQRVSQDSLIWKLENLPLINSFLKDASELIEEYQKQSIDYVAHCLNTKIPIIHNVFRWWKPHVLKELIIFRFLINKPKYSKIFSYLWLAVNKASLDCANIHRNHPTITFDDNHTRNINVFEDIKNNLIMIQSDLKKLSSQELCYSQLNHVSLGNSTSNLQKHIFQKVNFVITSPPYPNRYSYVHQTRPQLYFMELLKDVKQATEIDLKAIGGTWGRATSILQKNLISPPDDLKPYLDYYSELSQKSILMCNYATKYFIDMQKHIRSLKEVTSSNFRGAYVVGNSRLSGVEVFTEVILARMFEKEGFEVDKIITFRKRGGKKKLYETAICIRD